MKAFSSSSSTLWKPISTESLLAITFKSTAGMYSLWRLNTSRIKRLILLRTTEQPTFLLTVTPNLGSVRSLSFQTTKKPLTTNLFCEFNKSTKSARFRSLTDFGNVPIIVAFLCLTSLFSSNSY